MPKFYDTILVEYIKNPWWRWLSLDDLALKYRDYKMISYGEVTQKKKLNFKDVDLQQASIYSGEDVYITWELYKKQMEEEKNIKCRKENEDLVIPVKTGIYSKDKQLENIKESINLNSDYLNSDYSSSETINFCELIDSWSSQEWQIFSVLYDIEIPLIEVLKNMEISGVRIDRDKLKWIWILLSLEIQRLEKEIHVLAWEEFNIKSPKQVWEILFWKLNLESGKKTKTWFSVDNEVLTELAKKYEIAWKISDYRSYTKLLSTYVEWLQESASIEDDLIHTNYNQTIAATGRLSSTDPNLQNIPVWNSIAWEIRQAFIPYKEHDLILTFDYSQVEIRILAILSQDENLLNSFRNNEDIHYNTAKFIFWRDEISKDERKIAKAVNFWVIYWISSFWLSKMIDINMKEWREYIDKFFQNYPRVRDFFDKIVKWCEENGYVETLYGRKRFIAGINDRNRIIKDAAKRESINMPIQWTSADIIKLAMIKIDDFIKEKWLSSRLIMQVHDELVFSVKKEEKEFLKKEIKNIMENILTKSSRIWENQTLINLAVDIGEWNNRWEAK